MKNTYYILDEHHNAVAVDFSTWAGNFEAVNNRRVAINELGGSTISTVFLGIDHNFSDDGDPLLFETIIFGGTRDQFQKRYSTWKEAEEGHNKALAEELERQFDNGSIMGFVNKIKKWWKEL